MEAFQKNRAYILGKAFQTGRTALVDPVPELWDESSSDSRAETMRIYFARLADKLGKEYEELAKEPVGPELGNEILEEMEHGFEALMDSQPGYHEVGDQRESPEIRAKVLREMEKIFEELVEERIMDREPKPKDIWIEEEAALKFVRSVFETLKHDHVR